MSRNTPTNIDDMIDLDDVRERIEELESERTDLVDAVKEASEVYALGPDGETEDAEAVEALRDLASWFHKQLESAYEYQFSGEGLEGTMCANEYEFTVDGERA